MSAALDVMAGLVLEDGRRWGEVAEAWQHEDAEAVLEPGAGPRQHYLTRPRGASKTTDLGGMSVAALVEQLPAGAQGFAAAADRDQARLLVAEMAGFVRRSGLSDVLEVETWQVASRSSGASVVALPADGPSAYGLRPRWLIVDELGQWAETSRVAEFWQALYSSVGKVEACRLGVITTEPPPGTLGHRVLAAAVESPGWRVHRVPGPPPWMSAAAVAEQERLLLPSAFRRLILNEPNVADEDRLASWEDLRAAVDEGRTLLEPEAGHRYVVAVDLGLKHDRTVLVVAHLERDEGGEDYTVVDRVQRWSPKPGSSVDLREVEQVTLMAARSYKAAVTLDPWQAALLAQRLRAERVTVNEFAFSASSVGRLAFGLFQSIANHRLELPDDPELLDELARVRLRTNSAGVVRLDHASGDHDDQAVALALAIHALSEVPRRRRRRLVVVNGDSRAAVRRAGPVGLSERDAARWRAFTGGDGPEAA